MLAGAVLVGVGLGVGGVAVGVAVDRAPVADPEADGVPGALPVAELDGVAPAEEDAAALPERVGTRADLGAS